MNKKLSIAVVLLLTLALLAGCSHEEPQRGYSVYDLVQEAEKSQQQEFETTKEKYKDEYDKHYGNNVFLEDLVEVRSEFKELYKAKLTRELTNVTDYPFFITEDIEFYNSSLKLAKDGELSFEDLLNEPENHIRKFNVELYIFYKKEEHKSTTDDVNTVIEEMWEEYLGRGINAEFYWYAFDPEILKTENIEDLKQLEYPLIKLSEYGLCEARIQYKRSGEETYSELFDHEYFDPELMEFRKSKYGKDFLVTKDEFREGGYFSMIPTDRPDLWFEAFGEGDLYLKVVTQDILYDRIKVIIDEEGGGGDIALAVYPRRENGGGIEYATTFDFTKEFDEIKFVNEVYTGRFDINFMYLVSDGENIDYKRLQRICSRVYNLFELRETTSGNQMSPAHQFVHFYNIEKSKKNKALELFEENKITQRYFVKASKLNDMHKNMYKIRDENESFIFLDLFAKKHEDFLMILSDPIHYDEDEFLTKYKTKSLFY